MRAIAKKYRLSRNTVKKYLRGGEVEPRYQRRQECKPKLGPFLGDLEQLFEEDAGQQSAHTPAAGESVHRECHFVVGEAQAVEDAHRFGAQPVAAEILEAALEVPLAFKDGGFVFTLGHCLFHGIDLFSHFF